MARYLTRRFRLQPDMNDDQDEVREVAKQIERILDVRLLSEIGDSRNFPTYPQARQSSRLGFAYIGAAVFCAFVAFLPLASADAVHIGIWLTFGAVLLLMGGMKIDAANRIERRAQGLADRLKSRQATPPRPCSGPELHRVK